MQVLLQYQSKSYYIIGQEVYYSIGRFITLSGSYYIIGRFLLHYRAVITVSVVYYIIGWYSMHNKKGFWRYNVSENEPPFGESWLRAWGLYLVTFVSSRRNEIVRLTNLSRYWPLDRYFRSYILLSSWSPSTPIITL